MRVSLLALVLAAVLAAVPAASNGPPSTAGWKANVSFANGRANVDLVIDNLPDLLAYPGSVSKMWGNPLSNNHSDHIPIPGEGGAWLRGLELVLDADPQVKLNFWVEAGAQALPFSITSNLLTLNPISGEGTATAAVTLTDTDGNGATATGLFAGDRFYEAYYSGGGLFGQLVAGTITAPAYGSTTASQAIPPWQAMGSVSDMQSKFNFLLSANDLASGTSNFVVQEVIPEPAGFIALLSGLVGLASVVTRRRR